MDRKFTELEKRTKTSSAATSSAKTAGRGARVIPKPATVVKTSTGSTSRPASRNQATSETRQRSKTPVSSRGIQNTLNTS